MSRLNPIQTAVPIYYPPPTLDQRPELPYLELENYRFHCRQYGQEHRHTLLVLHGGPGGDFLYLQALRELANAYRVVFYDQRGTGLSPRTAKADLHLLQYIEDVTAFVNHCRKQGPVSLLGHSWGAHLALQWVARHPLAIHKLILAEAFIPSRRLSLRIFWHNLQWGIIPTLLRAASLSRKVPHLDAHARKDYFFGRILKEGNPGYNCPGQTAEVPANRAGWEAFQQLSFARATKRAECPLSHIRFPPENMLMLRGSCNQLLNKSYFENIQHILGNPALLAIPRAGHYLFSDNPEACLEEIRTFMA